MAARKNRIVQNERTIEKIKVGLLLKRLEDHGLANLLDKKQLKDNHLSATQLTAIEMLLSRTVPKLQQIEIVGDPDNPLQVHSDSTIKIDPETRDLILKGILDKI